MNHQQYKNIAFWLMIICVVILSIYVLWWTRTNGYQCLVNPLSFGIKFLEEKNNAELTCLCADKALISNVSAFNQSNIECSCFANSLDGGSARFLATSDGVKPLDY